jgi:hypothetical protein
MASLILSSGYRMTPFLAFSAILFNYSSSSAYCGGLLPTFSVTLGNFLPILGSTLPARMRYLAEANDFRQSANSCDTSCRVQRSRYTARARKP